MDMHVDKHKIKLWSIPEVEKLLSEDNIEYKVKNGFDKTDNPSGVPVFVLKVLIN